MAVELAAAGTSPPAEPFALPASSLQEETFEAFGGGASDFGIAVVWRLHGPLDERALGVALEALAQRHEALRTRLRRGPDGLEQLIDAHPRLTPVAIALDDRRARRRFLRLLERRSARPFELDGGSLARADLYRLGARDHVLLLDLHHAIVDGWSARLLLRDFHRLYAAAITGERARLGAEPLQFGDYAAWERTLREPSREAFWRARLARPARLRFPGQQGDAGRSPFGTDPLALAPVPGAVLRALTRVGGARTASTAAVVRTGLIAALAPYAIDGVVAIGVIDANRERAELQRTVGFVVDFLPLHVDVGDEPTFAELLRRTAVAWSDVKRQRLPSGAIHALAPDAGGPRRGRPYDVTLNLTPPQATPSYSLAVPGGTLHIGELVGRHMRAVHALREATPLARLAFVCALDPRGTMRSWIAPNNAALPQATIASVGARFTTALRRASADPFRPIATRTSA